jgi:hypothetical protein
MEREQSVGVVAPIGEAPDSTDRKFTGLRGKAIENCAHDYFVAV